MQRNNLLILFAKEPKKGHVKTRLAKEIGEAASLELYQALLKDTVAEMFQLPQADLVLFHPPESNRDRISEVIQQTLPFHPQSGKDLGERMTNAFEWGFQAGYQKIVIMGADCPLLTHSLLEQAFFSLSTHDIVLGPCQDGGYYLIGESHFHSEPFQKISWSTETVLNTTLHNLQKYDLSYHLLPVLFDIDTKKDLEQLKKLQKTHPKGYTFYKSFFSRRKIT